MRKQQTTQAILLYFTSLSFPEYSGTNKKIITQMTLLLLE